MTRRTSFRPTAIAIMGIIALALGLDVTAPPVSHAG